MKCGFLPSAWYVELPEKLVPVLDVWFERQSIRLGSRNQLTETERTWQLRIIGAIMHPIAIGALFGLQCFHVLFLGLHDWIPLGRLNDVKAVRAANPGRKLLLGTLVSLAPFAFGLAVSAYYLGRSYPHWLI